MFSIEAKIERPVIKRVKVTERNMSMLVPVDQYDSQEFNFNEAGWIRNSIAQIARAQSIDEYNKLAARMVEVRVQNNLPEDVTDEQAFDMIKPRFAQSANEVQQFIEMSHDVYMKRMDDAYRKAVPDVPNNGESSSDSSSSDN